MIPPWSRVATPAALSRLLALSISATIVRLMPVPRRSISLGLARFAEERTTGIPSQTLGMVSSCLGVVFSTLRRRRLSMRATFCRAVAVMRCSHSVMMCRLVVSVTKASRPARLPVARVAVLVRVGTGKASSTTRAPWRGRRCCRLREVTIALSCRLPMKSRLRQ